MTDVTWGDVGLALLGRWPSQVAQWGEAAIDEYIRELQVERLDPDEALSAIRLHSSSRGGDFPPSVAQVSRLARRTWCRRDYALVRARFERRELAVVERAQIGPGESNEGGRSDE